MVFSAFSVKLASTANVGIGVANPTSALQLAAGSTFDLGTAKAQWTDTGIYAANAVATSAGTTYQCTVTGPNNGLYTAAVISNVSVPANGAYFTIANNLVSGATYQISLTASGTNGAKLYITNGATTLWPRDSEISQLTSTLTTRTGDPIKTSGSMLYMVISAPVSSGMSVQFKDLSVARLDTSLSGNVSMNNNASLYLYNYSASNNAGLRANPGGDTVFFNGTGGVDDRMVLQSGTGNLGIGVTVPSQKLDVAGNIKASSFFSWTTSHWYTWETPTWNPGDAGNWPVAGYKFLITLMGHPGLGGQAVRATYIVYHSRWTAGNNNFGMITPIGTPQWISATAITDGGMSFSFNSGTAQQVYINVMGI